jgi:5'-deoxynucleotidase YfbR-like HD superfamily hydrolase
MQQVKVQQQAMAERETEEAILREITRELTSPNLAEHLFKLYKERNKKQRQSAGNNSAGDSALTDRINRLLDMVESGIGDMTAAAERIDQYTKRKKELEYELAQTAAQVEYTVEHFRGYLDHISKTWTANLILTRPKKS